MEMIRRHVRRHVSEARRGQLGRLIKAMRREGAAKAAALVAVPLRLLPTAVGVELRRQLRMSGLLDHPRHSIRLGLSSRTEFETRLHSCRKEPETVEWLATTLADGGVFYDIGANVGAYSLVAAAELGARGSVYAFEPGFLTFASLVDNVMLNRMDDRIIPLQVALSDANGMVRFQYSSLDAGSARHAGIRGGAGAGTGESSSHMLPAMRLDDVVPLLGLAAPTSMKIDVDGSEEAVLAGAYATLRHPGLRNLLVEVDAAETSLPKVRELLEAAGFALESEHPRGGAGAWNWIWSKA